MMARPRIELPAAQDLLALADSEGRLALRVIPGARGEGMAIEAGRLTIKVRARPEDGKANAAVLALLAAALDIAPARLILLRGASGRDKLVQIAL